MSNVEHEHDAQHQNDGTATDVTISTTEPPTPPCPDWCTRPDLPEQAHRSEWDFIEEAGMSRNHARAYGEHVALTGVEYSQTPGVVEDLIVQVNIDAGARLSYGDAIALAARLVQAAADLEQAGARS